jgi:hypothetical protein
MTARSRGIPERCPQLIRGDANRAGQLRLCLAPRLRVARIYEGEMFAPVHARFYFVGRDSGCIRCDPFLQ